MSDNLAPQPLHITVVSDVVCPWCFIGKRHLEAALELFAEAHPGQPSPAIEWSAFQLNPDMPSAGMDRSAYVQNKFGDRVEEIMARMTEAGERAGIAFQFDDIKKQPNPLGLHALIAAAETEPQQLAVVEALFDAYFLKGLDLTDKAVIISVVAPFGLHASVIEACLTPDAAAQNAVATADAHWRSLEVSGVPLFVFERKWAVSGAQPAQALFEAMVHALEERAK